MSSVPPEVPPPPPPPMSTPPAPGANPNVAMLVLAYFGILCLVPLLVEKNDREVQWHAKHGLVLFGAEVILFIALAIVGTLLSSFVPMLGCVLAILYPLTGLGIVALHIVCIVKALKGERLIIPYVSEYAGRF